MKNLALFILILLVVTSCVTQKKCHKKFPPQSIVKEVEVITEIYKDSIIPGATVLDTFMLQEIVEIPVNRWISVPDTSGKAELRIMKNEYNQLIIDCTAKEEVIKKHEQIITELREVSEVEVLIKTPKWAWWLLGINLSYLSFLIIKYLVKLKTLSF